MVFIIALKNIGRRMLFWGALALTIICGYEFIIRIDAMVRPLAMFINMWIGEKIAFARAVSYVDWGMFGRPAYLLLCVVMGITAMLGRKKKGVWLFAMLISAFCFVLSKRVQTLLLPGMFNTILYSCLLLIFIGSLLSFIANIYLSKKIKSRSASQNRYSIQYDPFNIHRHNN